MAGDYNPELCANKHTDMDRRVGVLETSWADNLKRLYDKIDELTLAMMRRLPVWVTVVISFLSAVCAGLVVALAGR